MPVSSALPAVLSLALLAALSAAEMSSPDSAAAPMPMGRRWRDIVQERFPKGNVWMGATISAAQIQDRTIDAVILNREFSYTTPENDFKQSTVHAEPGAKWRWEKSDAYLANCREHRQAVRAHAPIGPQSSPWVLDDARTPDELRLMLGEYLTALYDRYGKEPLIHWVDVVNETVERDGSWFGPKPGSTTWENPWTILGHEADANQTPLYISAAFAMAARLPPRVKLIYNQHTQLERAGMERVKATILHLRAKGLRVDGLGWQAHVDMGWEKQPGNLAYLSELITWAHANGLEFHVTENNVKLPRSAKDAGEEDAAAAQTFAAIVRTLLEHRDSGVVAWNCWHVRDYLVHGKNRLALPFAEDGRPKQAYYAIQRLLEDPPPVLK